MTATTAAPPIELKAPDSRRMRWTVWKAFWTSRLVVLLVGMQAVLDVGNANGVGSLDPSGLTHPFGYFGNLIAAPFARWDSVWYLSIAKVGYQGDVDRTVFFPLYPDMIRAVGWVVGSDLVAGVLISLVCFATALVLLYQLTAMDFGEDVAGAAVWLVAFFPTAFFFSAVYTESLFLALSIGCILQARRGHWIWCGVLGGLAAASRNGGALLLVPVLILLLYGPRQDGEQWLSPWARGDRSGWRALRPKYRAPTRALFVFLIPIGLIAYLYYLDVRYGLSSGPFRAEAAWYHKQTWPFGGAWQGIITAWDGMRQILHGPPPPLYTKRGEPVFPTAAEDVELLGFLVLAVIGFVGVARRLPFAYTAYVLVGLALPLSDPVTQQPLQSLARYEVVLFPLFIWFADVVVRRRWLTPAVATSAVVLGFFTAEFATWRFVA